ncbi:MAG: polyprenyl synthetase family protein [Candidatus Nanohalobium sp.]
MLPESDESFGVLLEEERRDINELVNSIFGEEFIPSLEAQETFQDIELGDEALADVVSEAYSEDFSRRSEMVNSAVETDIGEESHRFINPEINSDIGHPPKRLRPSMARWVGRELVNPEDADWDRILLPQGSDRLREDYSDPEEKFYKELDRLSVALEFEHNYTLVHDDVQDGDDTRREVPTVWRSIANKLESEYGFDSEEAEEMGQRLAINIGNHMHDLAYSVITSSDFTDRKVREFTEYFSNAGMRIAEGQQRDLLMEKSSEDNEKASKISQLLMGEKGTRRDNYLDMNDKKTGYLYTLSAALGAIAADASDEEIEAVSKYARPAAWAFQIRDDMNELENARKYGMEDVSDNEKKPTDVLNGKETLSYIRAEGNVEEELERYASREDEMAEAVLRRMELEREGLNPEKIDEMMEEEGYRFSGNQMHWLKDEKRPVEHDSIMINEAYGDNELDSDQVKDTAARVLKWTDAEKFYDICAKKSEEALDEEDIYSEELIGLVEYMQSRDF